MKVTITIKPKDEHHVTYCWMETDDKGAVTRESYLGDLDVDLVDVVTTQLWRQYDLQRLTTGT